MDLSAFNPHALTEDDFVASFVARQTTLDHLLQQLRLVQPDQPARDRKSVV